MVTTEENLISTADARTSELIGVGKSLSDVTQDRARRDEKELADTREGARTPAPSCQIL
jgi:hypothetical protein